MDAKFFIHIPENKNMVINSDDLMYILTHYNTFFKSISSANCSIDIDAKFNRLSNHLNYCITTDNIDYVKILLNTIYDICGDVGICYTHPDNVGEIPYMITSKSTNAIVVEQWWYSKGARPFDLNGMIELSDHQAVGQLKWIWFNDPDNTMNFRYNI